MKYNEIIESKERLMKDFDKFFNLKFNFGVNIKLIDVIVHQPQYSYIDCLIKSESYSYDVEFIINIESESETIKQSVHVEIPKMSGEGFLISNGDGVLRWRSCINVGEVRKRIRLYKNTIETRFFNLSLNLHRLQIGYEYPMIIIDGKNYNLFSVLLANGYTQSDIFTLFMPDDKLLFETVISKYQLSDTEGFEFPKVNEQFVDKYYQLTGIECEEQIKACDLVNLIRLAKNNPEKFDNFSPFDVNFISNYDAFINELNACYYELVLKLTNYYSRHRKYNGDILTKSIKKIFSLGKNKYAIIQTASDSNPAGFLGQSKKIYFYNSKGQKVELKYNEDFVGIVCPVKTPESVSLVDVKNELAIDVDIIDGHPEISLLDKLMNKVKIPYRQYYRKKILISDFFDYENKEIVPKDGFIKYLYSGKYYKEKYINPEQFDYIQYSKKSILSYNASLIPMMNKNDSVRLAMGTNMIDQAIPTTGSSPAICATGTEKDIYNESDWSYKSPYSGKVIDIINNFIKILDNEGQIHIVSAPPDMSTSHGTYNKYIPTVKIGDNIKAGDVIVSSNSFKHNQLCLTTQLVVAFVNYGFHDEEDGIILSSDATELLGHDMSKELIIRVPTGLKCILSKDKFIEATGSDKNISNKLGRLNQFGLPKVGDTFKKGDIVAAILEEADPDKYYRARLKKNLDEGTELLTMFYQLPYGMKEGTVESISVLIPKGITEDGLPEVRKYYEEEFDKYQKSISERFQEIVHIKRDIPDPDYRCIIKIKFRYINRATLGNKVSNVYASKGVIVRVIDKEFMPRIGGPDGLQVQMIMSPKSTINRKNIAQRITAQLGYLSVLAHKKHEKCIEDNDYNTIRTDLNKLYITDRFSNYSDEDLIKFHKEFGWYYQLQVGPTDDKYDKNVVRDLSTHFGVSLDKGEKLWLPEFNTYTKQSVEVGVASIMRLHFFPEAKMSATGSAYSGEELAFGVGKYRPGGQCIGEMENWSLMAHGNTELIDDLTGHNLSQVVKSRLETEMLMLGLAIDPMRMLQ